MNENFDDYCIDEDLDDINYIEAASPDFRTELAKQLAEIAPEAIADGKVDFEKLKELLGDDVSTTPERFGLFWPGKREAIRIAQTPTTATLKPDFENSVDWDTTENVFIEGDNLEVLKILQRHYYGKIKMIYIDPPYNTGQDFIYEDDFKDGIANYLQWSHQMNEQGRRKKYKKETDGRFHSKWLSMIYSRLKLARNLLSQDGVIFISIDDNEQATLKKICDEVFGESNFIANVIVDATPKNDPLLIATSHEYALVYVRNRAVAKQQKWGSPHPLAETLMELIDGKPFGEAQEVLRNFYKQNDLCSDNISNYKYVDNQGIFRIGPIDDPQSKGPKDQRVNPNTGNPLKIPPRGWGCNLETWNQWKDEGLIAFPQDDNRLPAKKTYLTPDKLEVGRSVVKMQSRKTTTYLGSLFGVKKIFEHPKPLELLKMFLNLDNSEQPIFLDFFAGSGTLAEVVMRLNAEDGGKRKFIVVELPNPVPEKSAADRAGFTSISEITRKRIQLSGEKICGEADNAEPYQGSFPDVGFRAYKLSETNFTKWNISSAIDQERFEQELLEFHDSADDMASIEDLLMEILLKQGFSLTEKTSDVEISGLSLKAIYESSGGGVALLAYLDQHRAPTIEQLREVIATKPTSFIILEDCFGGSDELKTNLAQMCKTNNVELWTA